jgi:hypothetical protein
MSARILLPLVAAAFAVAALTVSTDARAAAIEVPQPACNGGACSGGWYRGAVTVTWSVGCGATTVSEDTSGQQVACSYTQGTVTVSNYVVVRKDSSPPGVTLGLSRGPDSNGWYTKPLSFSATGDDGASGVASCTSGTYGGPDAGEAKITASCTDNAGNTGSGSTSIKYDATAPEVAAAPDRPANKGGWYNATLRVSFTGKDAGSGVKECSPPVEYKGPDANPAKLVGQCRDNAGHLSAPLTFEFRFDATKPPRPVVTFLHRGGSIALSWKRARDVVRSEVVRSPGLRGKRAAVVWGGRSTRFVDRKIASGTRYWYEVRSYDQAGNVAKRAVGARPVAGILSPANGTVLRGRPVIEWVAVRKARFYNVQIWRGRTKVLTTWPTTTKLAVPRSWRFAGKRQRLAPGPYRVFIWPAFGTPKKPGYGRLVGQVGFVLRR